MEYRQRLANNLVSESEAYGYTLSIWGAGTLLINAFGSPGVAPVFLFVGGALTAFVTLALFAFPRPFASIEPRGERKLGAASIIHIVATLGNLLLAKGALILALKYGFGLDVTALIIGYQTTITYNLLLLLESRVVQLLE
jgi:hypothetical protein